MKIKSTLICISMFLGTFLFAETLTLKQCIDIAQTNNPTIQQRQLSSEIGKSKVKQSFSAIMPSVSVSSGLGSSSQNSWDLSQSMGISAGLTFYRPGLYSGIKSAKITGEANRAASISTQNDITTQVSTLYFRILSTKTLIQVYEGNIAVAEENLKKTRSMYKLKVITESDVLKSEVQKGDFESQLLIQKQLYISYLRSMNILLGRDANTGFDVADVDVDNIDIPQYDIAWDMMLKRNPDYESAQLQEQISKVVLNASKEAYLPSLSGQYSYTNTFDPLLTPTNSVNLSASWTLFNGLSRRENVQQKKLELEQTRITLDNTLRLLEQQLRDYYTQFETYTAMIDINKRRLKSAQRDFSIVNQQYRLGKVTILDRMQAQISVLSAESSLVEAQYSRKMVESEIHKLINKK
ncbi:MAG: TolC family protein [Candidatus Marinimicrobia bacterium]|nr:TolC family protein [Candidatus Neomarinimicrobiota bacterium]